MTPEEIKQHIDNLQGQINALKAKPSLLGPNLDPSSSAVLKQYIRLPYYTTAPTFNPGNNGVQAVVKTGGLYYLYCYVDGGWRRVQIS